MFTYCVISANKAVASGIAENRTEVHAVTSYRLQHNEQVIHDVWEPENESAATVNKETYM